MSPTSFRPTDDLYHTPLRPLLVFIAAVVAMAALMICTAGCSSPGGAGFKELVRSNARERTALKAVRVDTEAIGRHTASADALAVKLAATQLTKQQAEWLDELRVELKATQTEKDALSLKISGIQTLVDQRDATIRQTQGEVKSAVHDAWWDGVKFVLWTAAIVFAVLSILGLLFRATLRAGLIAASASPPVAAVLNALPSR